MEIKQDNNDQKKSAIPLKNRVFIILFAVVIMIVLALAQSPELRIYLGLQEPLRHGGPGKLHYNEIRIVPR